MRSVHCGSSDVTGVTVAVARTYQSFEGVPGVMSTMHLWPALTAFRTMTGLDNVIRKGQAGG